MVSIRGLIEHFLKPEHDEELEDFAEWAFGKEYRDFCHSMDFLNGWNHIHGDELYLSSNGYIEEDVLKMIELWNEEGWDFVE